MKKHTKNGRIQMTNEMPFLDRMAFAYIRQDLGKRQMFFKLYNCLGFSIIPVLSFFVFREKISAFWLLLVLSNFSLVGLFIYYLNCVEFKKQAQETHEDDSVHFSKEGDF